MNDSAIKSLIEKTIEENNRFLITNMESIMNDHKQPSPVTIEMIKRLDERDTEIIKRLEDIKNDQKESNKNIETKLEALKSEQDELKGGIRVWKWVLPSISGIATVIITNLIMNFINK